MKDTHFIRGGMYNHLGTPLYGIGDLIVKSDILCVRSIDTMYFIPINASYIIFDLLNNDETEQ